VAARPSPRSFVMTWRTHVTDPFDHDDPFAALRSAGHAAALPSAAAVRHRGSRRQVHLRVVSAAGAVVVLTAGAGVATAAQGLGDSPAKDLTAGNTSPTPRTVPPMVAVPTVAVPTPVAVPVGRCAVVPLLSAPRVARPTPIIGRTVPPTVPVPVIDRTFPSTVPAPVAGRVRPPVAVPTRIPPEAVPTRIVTTRAAVPPPTVPLARRPVAVPPPTRLGAFPPVACPTAPRIAVPQPVPTRTR
jgi:hypothetical protein